MQKVRPEEEEKINKPKNKWENYVGRVQADINEAEIGNVTCCCCLCCCKDKIAAPHIDFLQGGLSNLKDVQHDPKLQKTKFRILFNPSSGGGNCLKIVNKIKEQLEFLKQTDRVEWVQSKSLEHFKEVVQEYDYETSGYVLVICGGDGSICNALNFYHEGILREIDIVNKEDIVIEQDLSTNKVENLKQQIKNDKTLKIGILPGGTGNDLCVCFDYDPDYLNIERLLKTPVMRRIDIWKVTYFDENNKKKQIMFQDHIGIGLTGRVIEAVNNSCFYKLFFRSKYKLAAMRESIKFKNDIMTVKDENGKIIADKRPVQFMTFNNMQVITKIYRNTPFSQIDDGIIDLSFYSCDNFGQFKQILQQKNGMSIYSPQCNYYRGKKFTVIFEGKVLAAYDGELITCQGQMDIEAAPDALNIIY